MNTPCYVVFANAQPIADQGAWSFTVQPLDGSPPLTAAAVEPDVSGERLELLALVRAFEAVDQPGQVMVCCDSPRIERQLNQGFDDWRAAGWRWEAFGEMAPIPNADLWRRIDRAMHIHYVSCRRTPPTLAPLAVTPASVPMLAASDLEPAAMPAFAPAARNEESPEAAPPAEVESPVMDEAPAIEQAAEPATLPMTLPRHPPKKRRARRPARATRQTPTWDQLVDNLRQGMQRLRTVAATLA